MLEPVDLLGVMVEGFRRARSLTPTMAVYRYSSPLKVRMVIT